MTPRFVQTDDMKVDSELERLTYSAYLLTLDPALALSVVMAAIDGSLEDVSASPDLETRTLKLSLKQLQLNSDTDRDHVSSAYEAALYSAPSAADSTLLAGWGQDASSNPIFMLDSSSRVAFVLHHVLGYEIKEAATLAGMTEKEFRAQLRSAYLQLALRQQGSEVQPISPGDSAQA
jgi:hypothetical protein